MSTPVRYQRINVLKFPSSDARTKGVEDTIEQARRKFNLGLDDSLEEAAILRFRVALRGKEFLIIEFDEAGNTERVIIMGPDLTKRALNSRHRGEDIYREGLDLVINYMVGGYAPTYWPVAEMVEHLEELFPGERLYEAFEIHSCTSKRLIKVS